MPGLASEGAGLERGRLEILGVRVSPIHMNDAIEAVESWIRERRPNYVCITGVHGVIASQSDAELRKIHSRAGLVTPDGMPLVWMARLLGFRRTRRVYGPDLMRELTALSAIRGYRQFYYGGGEDLADNLARALTQQHPALQIAGTYCPPFRPLTDNEDRDIVERINKANADIVWVGLSTPKQEYWMAAHAGRLNAPVLIGVGAAFDFLAGTKSQAPFWMQRSGLEWLFRLLTEPRRLWRRYFEIVPRFLIMATVQLMTTTVQTKSKSNSR